MNNQVGERQALLSVLEEFGRCYPDWRFGQLVSNVACWVDDRHWTTVDDEQLQVAVRSHLDRRFGDLSAFENGSCREVGPARKALLDALAQLGQRYPERRLVQLVSNLAALAHVNVYDVEDAQLLATAQSNNPGVQWFEWYINKYARESTICGRRERGAYRCPCCRHLTLYERGGFEICPVCFWEDDGQDDADADTVRGGPNGSLSLTQARDNYLSYGVCESRFAEHVRPPRQQEV